MPNRNKNPVVNLCKLCSLVRSISFMRSSCSTPRSRCRHLRKRSTSGETKEEKEANISSSSVASFSHLFCSKISRWHLDSGAVIVRCSEECKGRNNKCHTKAQHDGDDEYPFDATDYSYAFM